MRRLTQVAIVLMLALFATGTHLRGAHADEGTASVATLSDYEAALASHRPMMLEFGATWCGPCKEMGQILDRLQPQWKERVAFVRFDIDSKDGSKLMEQKNVTEVPYFIFVDRNGKTVSTATGPLPQQEIEKRLNAIAAADPAAQKASKEGEGCCGGSDGSCCKKSENPKQPTKPAH